MHRGVELTPLWLQPFRSSFKPQRARVGSRSSQTFATWLNGCTMSEVAKEYDLLDPGKFKDFLTDANIQLVRVEYLREICRMGQLWPRHQEA